MIDPALLHAGWDVRDPAKVGLEIPVDGTDPAAWQRLQAELNRLRGQHRIAETPLPAGISDYVLYRPNGEVIAVVEAKKTSVDPRLAQAQAEFYVDQIAQRQSFRPFAFMTNGEVIYFLDAGMAHKREVFGFFSPADLENLLFLRQSGKPLAPMTIATRIADRPYQHEAIRRVCEAFDAGKRKALLTMATGTGKTRTAMALIDLFFRADQARRVLFVADRDELVKQALDDGFRKHLPDEPCTRIFSQHIATDSRLYAVTLQTLSLCFERFSPGFFDLIIFDEVHRSIFNQWSEPLQYFDARQIGLTATPADFIERNTFLSFDCTEGIPTFLYAYPQAVAEKYLVDYALYRMQTKFQRRGIRGVDLAEEDRNALIAQGIDPDELDYSGTDLERRVSNTDTIRKQWQEIWDACLKDESGQQPGKTIVFAMTQKHALRLAEVFGEMFPQFPETVQVITAESNYRGTLIDEFKKQDQPRIAITVDLLETGVDVPEVVNLVFMKPVQSRIKLEQMIGRGTRSDAACHFRQWLPNARKTEFYILDFWENDFSRDAAEEQRQSLPVLVTIFNTRLRLLALELQQQSGEQALRLVTQLRAQIAEIPVDSFSVRRLLPDIQSAFADSFWSYLTANKLDFLRTKVGPLLRYVPGVDVAAATFTSKIERLKLQLASGTDTHAAAESIAEDVSRLPSDAADDPASRAAVAICLPPTRLQQATPSELDQVADTLAPAMRRRRAHENSFLTLDLPDFVELRGYILLKGGTERIYIEEYKRRVDERVLSLIDADPAVGRIAAGANLDDEELLAIERLLRRELGGVGLELDESNVRKAYGWKVGSLLEFMRQLFGIGGIPAYAEIVQRQFETYITAHPFNADQIRFLRALQSVFLNRRRIAPAELYESPFTQFGADAADRWFDPAQRADLLAFVETLTVL
ncbi:DEAD/DEAH box helicase family protein [Oscillochloris sp. ZM17-4]|uniref:type I restriction endonuclease subunit R n=1 Tax=Oscillochloris sp. ZM17-4 TaxID=2866714 RepID=UPI001C73DEF1|nr:DEAD/DEAH box helicase family protein [Oscillochloris sp. ZM17-4]